MHRWIRPLIALSAVLFALDVAAFLTRGGERPSLEPPPTTSSAADGGPAGGGPAGGGATSTSAAAADGGPTSVPDGVGGSGPPTTRPVRLVIRSQYAELTDAERSAAPLSASSTPARSPIVEGRAAGDEVWRMSASRAEDETCIELASGSARERAGASTSTCTRGDIGVMAMHRAGSGLVGLAGYAPRRAASVVLVTPDGRRASAPVVYPQEPEDAAFFVAFIDCGVDIDRFEARDERGRVIGTHVRSTSGPSLVCL